MLGYTHKTGQEKGRCYPSITEVIYILVQTQFLNIQPLTEKARSKAVVMPLSFRNKEEHMKDGYGSH